jgi:hypothetical protein
VTANQDSGRAGVLDLRFKRFAPGTDHVHVPVSSREAALAGIAFYTACRPETMRAQKRAWLATKILGPRVLAGPASPWAPPMQVDEWHALLARWRRSVSDFDSFAVSFRGGADGGVRVLLLLGGEARAVAKVHSAKSHRCGREELALTLMAESRPRTFGVPRIVASGREGEWRYLLLRPLPPGIHRVADNPPLTRIVAEIHTGLSGLPRPEDAPRHWNPMHGDLAPWTLRHAADGGLVILDWEEVAWAPPGADEVLYRAADAAITGRHPGPIHVREAVEFWRRRAPDSAALARRGADFPGRFLRALDAMTTSVAAGGSMP